jgi:hypothetical protein
MTRLRGTLVAVTVPLFLMTACAQTAGNSAAGAPSSPSGPPTESAPVADDLVLRVESLGGFVPAEQNLGRIPSVSVYGDGRVITQGPTTMVFPGPALPNLQVQMITPELVRELVRQGAEAGVRNGADFGSPNVADAPSTRVTAGDQSVNVMALSEAPSNDPQLTAAQRAARTKLSAYVKKLQDLPLGDGYAKPVAYDPTVIAALARPYVEPQGDQPKSPEMPWPGATLPGDKLTANLGIGCVDATGAEKDKIMAAAKKATAITPWTAGGAKWSLTFRPLLPEEKSCAALKATK